MIEPSIKLVEDCDIFVIIGTLLKRLSRRRFAELRASGPADLFDRPERCTYLSRNDIEHIQAGASKGPRG